MLKVELIGNLGADAEIKESQGTKFVAFRVAHTVKYEGNDGGKVERTDWVDVTLSNPDSKIVPFLRQGTKVFVRGNASLRAYSSPKDRCWKAGLSVSAVDIELCGAAGDEVPRELTDPNTGHLFKVSRFYQCDADTSGWKKNDTAILVDKRMNRFILAKDGWVAPEVANVESES